MEKLPEDKKNDRNAYFALYQKTLSEVMATLSKKEKRQMEATRDEWQAEGPPEEVQIKNAQRFGYRGIEEMHKVANKQFGMIVVTFSARRKRSGGWEYFSHDYNPSLNGPGEPVLPMSEWAKAECKVFGRAFAKYVAYTDEAKAGHVNSDNSQSANTRQGTVFKLEVTDSGLPLLPDPISTAAGGENYGIKREILRDFFVSHYRLATGKSGARVPWLAMSQDAHKFIKEDYIPPSVALNDPGRMDRSHVSLLLEHLRDRQKTDGVPTFLFHHQRRHDESVGPVNYPADALADNKKGFAGRGVNDKTDEANQSPEEEPEPPKNTTLGNQDEQTHLLTSKELEYGQTVKGKNRATSPDNIQNSDKGLEVQLADDQQLGPVTREIPKDNTLKCSTQSESAFANLQYAAGTTLRVDGNEFAPLANINQLSSHIVQTASVLPAGHPVVGAPGPQPLIPMVQARPLPNQEGSSFTGHFHPQHFPPGPFFSGYHPQYAGYFGLGQPGSTSQSTIHMPGQINDSASSVTPASPDDSELKCLLQSGAIAGSQISPANQDVEKTRDATERKRKRADSTNQKELDTSDQNKSPRVTRSRTGAIGTKKKTSRHERWDWVQDNDNPHEAE
ncbi:hypothetical protein CPB83DRAFT_939670 [Crepidotus variabilis]|uniref:Uncharacterized protein n=1 Tax=Crepidotus variabilis TaxID=179855 RepID=A0A9P6EPP6_9AGAR|nr:hypothetical protein CPB83DRAFT_939670 [Crepidotus variabilis]